MKNLFIFLFVLVSSILYSQNQTADSLVCIENDSLSFYRVPCMDCYENKNLLKRKHDVYLSPKLVDDKNKAYSEEGYLFGTFKDGKPYDGFFINMSGRHIELPIFDFYEEGNLIYQLYNDLFEGMTEERFKDIKDEDIEWEDTRILNKKNTLKNNKLWEGIQICPELIFWEGARVVLIADFKEGKEEEIRLLLFAMHYGGLITISNLENGYYFNHWFDNKVRLSYSELGSKIELINPKNKVFGSIKNEYVKFSKKAKEEQLKNNVLLH